MLTHLLLALQLSASASVTATATSSDVFYRDREVLGVRYHAAITGPAFPTGPVFIDAGGMLAAENGLFPTKSGGGVRHWAIAAGVEPAQGLRLSVIHGRFVQQRSAVRETCAGYHHRHCLPMVGYYAFVGAGAALVTRRIELSAEHLLWVPQQVSIGLNRWVFRFRSAPLDILIRQTVHADNQTSYAFWSGTATLRPFTGAKGPWRLLRPIGIEGGWRPVPSYTANRDVRLGYLALGIFARVGG